ncbi:beta-galactosidase [Sphaerimonospora mesophila]|uniref:beta-galactosidase n=1 Tax=Sphaerimonospora mesophila TaxID=37483 RepID=UPI0006E2B771
MRWPRGVEGLCYGGDYNPEQWPEDVWKEDVALMRRAGVNLVTVGVFSWSRIEPEEGRHDFGWLDRVLDLLEANGVKANLATPTASPPPWFGLAHPDALNMTAEGVRLTHGSRDTYCVSAPPYQEASRRIAATLAERYRDHPALAMWHVHNEYGTACHCDHAAHAFRAWLREKYGTLDALGDAWTTSFWSQRYSAWEQITPPRATQYLPNPTHVLDFRRFVSDEMLAHFRRQRDVLRELTPDVPITTNFVFGGWVPVDHWKWAREVDLVAIDDYPAEPGLAAAEHTAFAADLARSWAGGAPWLLMEQAPGVIYTNGRMTAKEPGETARHSLSHIARGSRGVMFFQWRASRGGAELWHAGMVPHAGPDSRIFREIAELGEVLDRLGGTGVSGAVEADVAVLWDYDAWWALQSRGLPSAELDYLDAVRQAHRVAWLRGLTVDFAHPSHDLSRYRAVLVPSLYLVSDAAAANLRGFVERGGTVVVSFFSGVADEHARVRLGGHPAAFRDFLGIRVEEFLPLAEAVRLSDGRHATIWSEHVHLEGAEAVSAYPDGRPAITRNSFGAGSAWYVSTRLGDEGYARVLADAQVLTERRVLTAGSRRPSASGRPAPAVAPGVEIVRRDSGMLFAINHTSERHLVPIQGVDLLTGARLDGVDLPPGGFAVLREDR